MKKFFILLLTTLTFCYSCNEKEPDKTSKLLGKWKLYDTYYSIGGPLIYKKVTKDSVTYLEFGTDGKLSDTKAEYKAYTLKDSVTINFTKTDDSEVIYFYSIKDGLLNLSPGGTAICIEGCGSRYKKVD
jgi:hypothetical protein